MSWQGESKQEIYETMRQILSCPCQILEQDSADRKLVDVYLEKREMGRKDGYIPVLIYPDKNLIDTVVCNLIAATCGREATWKKMAQLETTEYSEKSIKSLVEEAGLAEGRKCLLEAPLPDITERLSCCKNIEAIRQGIEDELREFDESLLEEFTSEEVLDNFEEAFDYRTGQNKEAVLAEIPVNEPWQVFAWLPFGGWNSCPGSDEMLAFAKRWYENWGAMPAVIGHDNLQFYVDTPLADEKAAAELAGEQLAFCFEEELMNRADSLMSSHVWYFWWD